MPVRRAVVVEATLERAFEVFTRGFDSWWPRTHHIGQAEMAQAVLDGPGGRWYERGVDGSECHWGDVLVWEPPHRVVLGWQIGPEFRYDADRARASEVEVRFTVEGPGRTRVELEHRHFERHGPGADKLQGSVGSEGGWGTLLGLYAATVAGTPAAR